MSVEVEASDRASWRRWLRENHRRETSVWLVLHKKASPAPTVGYEEAVEEALCYGWIDSRVEKLDELRRKQLFTPRRPGSGWSKSNKDRVARLIASKRMTKAGLALIEAAKADGSWTALDAVEALEVPDDLRAALASNRAARTNFSAFRPSVRKQLLYWIASAKRPETRAKRIAETVAGAAENRPATG
ncbi:MAG: YdeI/OmpD-associated family protein [Actinomycetota bacterium]